MCGEYKFLPLAETSNLLAKLISMKYKGRGNIREYIIEVSNFAAKLKSLKLELDEYLIVHLNKKRKIIKGAAKESSKGKKPKKNEEFTCFFRKKSKYMKKQYPNSHNEIRQIGSRGTKRELIENSVILWHKRLGHISKQRIQRLVSDEILEPLNLSNFKSQSLDVFKSFKAEVELQFGKKLKPSNLIVVVNIMILRDRSQSILRFGMKDSKPRDTLIAKGDKFSLKQCPNNDLERNETQNIPYASAVESLMNTQHWKTIKRLMRYLKRTRTYMLTYRKSEGLEIIRYFDFDFAGCQDSKRSMSGYIYMLVKGAIPWKSVKQTLIAPLTIVAEFMACFEASNHGIWLQNFVTSLRVVDDIEKPLNIYCDNNLVVLYSNNNRSSTKSKFIDIKFLK
ncbi:hypothetical protein CR513_43832, partial [Mucuna pruriens]